MSEENIKVLTVEDLKKKQKEIEELKNKIESQYLQLVGMAQLLQQQIDELSSK